MEVGGELSQVQAAGQAAGLDDSELDVGWRLLLAVLGASVATAVAAVACIAWLAWRL